MVSVLDSGADGPGFKSQPRRCLVTVLGKLFTPIGVSVHQAAKLVAALLRVAGVTVGLAESNGSLPPGLWLMSPAGWLPRTRISSGTLRSVIEYGLPLLLNRKSEFSCCTVVKLTQNQALGVYALSVHSSSFYSRISRAWTAKAPGLVAVSLWLPTGHPFLLVFSHLLHEVMLLTPWI